MKNKFTIKKKNEDLDEIEDVLLDVTKEDMEKIEDSFDPRNITIIGRIFYLALLILLFQAVNLQVIKGKYYNEVSQRNYTRTIAVRSSRGIIYDNNLKQIVFNVPVFDLVLTPIDFFKDKEKIEYNYNKLSEIANISKEELEQRLKDLNQSSEQSILVLENIKKDEALVLAEKIKEMVGVKIEDSSIRNYVDSRYFSHLIGYSGRISEKELKQQGASYYFNDIIGKSGLEQYYEKQMRGVYGEQNIEVDSFGREIKMIKKEEPVSGNNIVLNVDYDLQKKIYEAFEKITEKIDTKEGAVVAINPKNGAVMALASFPSYDNNLFAKGINNDEYAKLINDKSLPLFNRAVFGEYPPGSTFKPLMGSAALQEKVISPETTIVDRGVIYVGSSSFLGWTVLGNVDLIRALSMSSNIYFYTVGGGYGDIKGLGMENIKKYANLFGLGNVLGVDLPGEKAGFIPDEKWKQETKKEKWYIGDTYHVSIGQGDVLATPLQIADYIAAIANGGKFYQPQIVDRILDSKGNLVEDIQPKIIRENFIDLENIKWVQKGMRENVVSGSGRALTDLPVHAAGKTGTAQYAGNQKTHAWYVAYAPYENPEIVLAIIVEGGGEGHAAAAPIAKEVLKWYFDQKANHE